MEWQKGRDVTKEICHPLVLSLNNHIRQFQASQKPGASNTIWISHVGDSVPSSWPIFSWFSRHINWSFIGNGAAIPCGSLTCWGCTTVPFPVVLFNPISLFIVLTSSLHREKCCMDYALWGLGAHHLLYLQRGTFVSSVSIPVHFLVRC